LAILQKNVDSYEIKHDHSLFVEGSDYFDVSVLNQLFETHLYPQNIYAKKINIIQLGKSANISSAAENFYKSHTKYYFLTDRDNTKIDYIENCWANFPSKETKNLLIWRKREIENYFIDPEYIKYSDYLKSDIDFGKIEEAILKFANERLFSDVANVVLQEFDRCSKNKINQNLSEKDAIGQLKDNFQKMKKDCPVLTSTQIQQLFDEKLAIYKGNSKKLQFGKGEWLNLISGKEIMNSIFNNYFDVKGDFGQPPLTLKDKNKQIVKNLLKKDFSQQPTDFQQLVDLIKTRTN